MNALISQFLPSVLAYIIPILGTALTAIAYTATASFVRFSSAWVDAKHLATLNAAIETGVTNALAGSLPPTAAVQSASGYIKASVPAAINALKATESVLNEKINAAITKKISLAK